MANVKVIYHHFPHYRAPILRALQASQRNHYQFLGSLDDVAGIKAFRGDDQVDIHPLKLRISGRLWHLNGYWPAVMSRDTDALVVLANPNIPATWLIAIAGRLLGKKVIFWGHAWLRPESGAKAAVRRLYFRLADRVMVYGDRAKKLGTLAGYPPERIHPIYNSLDYERSEAELEQLASDKMNVSSRPQNLFEYPHRPLIICTARITAACRFDLLLTAAAALRNRGEPINILLVGDGPERGDLENQTAEMDLQVHFFGACYDEGVLAGMIYHADLTVSPGKIGLTVIHSLTYGTPAITHDNLDDQMPEVEAIKPGKTGDLFRQNDSNDLAQKISEWVNAGFAREEVRRQCQRVVADKWNPVIQARLIDDVVDQALGLTSP